MRSSHLPPPSRVDAVPGQRVSDVLFDSEAALRRVVSELAALHPHATPFSPIARICESRASSRADHMLGGASGPILPDAA